MQPEATSRVVFFQVRDNPTKLQRLAQTAQSHFEKGEPFLILVEDQKSQSFVDEFLWKEGFLPHLATDDPTLEKVAIAKLKINVNQAKVAFNLCPTPLLIQGPFRIIYEFEDLTTASKKTLSSHRYAAYKQAGYLIEAR